MINRVQLITYVDRLSGGGLPQLANLLKTRLDNLLGGVHLLPFYHPMDGADAGFDPIDHTLVDPRLGAWSDVSALGRHVDIVADLIVNHVSCDSPQFQDLSINGTASPYHGMFLTFDSVFPNGARESDLLAIYRPRPGLPFTRIALKNGDARFFWTTFTPKQIDINVRHPQGQKYLESILDRFAESGVKLIRLDAAGYAIKKCGTSCFMIPETFDFIAALAAAAHAKGIEVLVEIHSYYRQQVEIARQVDYVYDFALPPLVLHTLYSRSTSALRQWLAVSPRNAITVLDTHDGIGVIDVGADAADPVARPGLLPPDAIHQLVETIHERSSGQSRKATGEAASNLDLYQVNCTYYDALGRRDTEYLIARAIQFFSPGIPQVYYTGLLAGENDMELLARTGVGRDINRHYYSPAEIDANLKRPVVAKLFELIRFRNAHPAFQGSLSIGDTPDSHLRLSWINGAEWATLDVGLDTMSSQITYSGITGPECLPIRI